VATQRQHSADFGSGASDDAPEPSTFAQLMTVATGARYAYCHDSLLLRPKAGSEVIACRDLLEAETFAALIDRFGAAYPGADRRAVVSLWTLYYFSTLTIAVAVAGLELRRILPAALEDLQLCIAPHTAAPQAFVLPDLGYVVDVASIEDILHAVLRLHCQPLIDAMVEHSGAGRRMLWNNVAAYLDWIVAAVGTTTDQPDVADAVSLYKLPIWSDGWKNPLHGLIRPECSDTGEVFSRRKVCCLRYGVPGIGGCGQSCPLPQGRS
jgi:ferric iron reductase protein FhuF